MTTRLDMEFANDLSHADEIALNGSAWWQLGILTALFAAALGWASWATLDEVATAVGRVVPAQQVQVAQSLEGGIVRELLVREGATVDRDQLIMRIDDTGFSSRLGELRQRRIALRAELARLEAEASGADQPAFDAELEAEAPAPVAAERAAFQARKTRLATEIDTFEKQLVQRQQEYAELQARRGKLAAIRVPIYSELELNRRLEQRGNAPAVDVLRLERQLADIDGDIEIIKASLPRLEAAVAEARGRAAGLRAAFVAQVRERLTQAQAESAVIEELIRAAQDRVARTAVRSPVKGVVNRLTVTTIGAVVQPGQVLADVVPLDDALVVEARVRPKDVAFIHPGQRATVKFTAYDYLVYGGLDGEVERIGADSLRDERGEPYYLVLVRTSKSHLGSERGRLEVIPGLVGTVDIQTGQKTVLDYILKPILRTKHEAMRER